LRVIARGSSFLYRGRGVADRQIAVELGAQFLVRGSVQRADDRVRINVQLLDALEGLNVWGHRFDREMEDVFVVQDEISSTVVSTLAGRVEAESMTRARRVPAERLEAYDLLLRGKEHHHRYTADDCGKCIEMFERAIEQDPDYAVAHAWLACGLGQAIGFGLDEKARLVDQSQAAAERGLELDENEAECHRILAQVFLTRQDLKRSLWHQERALFLNPNDDRIVCAMGEILTFAGRAHEAEEWVRNAMRLNPYHPPRYWTHLARALFHQHRLQEALEALDHITRPRPDDLAYRIAACMCLGEEAAARGHLEELRAACPALDATALVASLGYAQNDDAQALLEPLLEAGAQSG
jgi:adenylate cyclase